MARLSQSDLESLLGYLEEISSFAELPAFREGILPGLRRLVPCDLAAYNELDPQGGDWEVTMAPRHYLARTNQEAFVRFMEQHPLVQFFSRPGEFPPVQLADVVTPGELHRLELYQEFFRPLDVEHQIVVLLPSTLPRLIGVSLQRPRHPFSERDRLLLDRLRPHLVQGYLDAVARTRMRRVLEVYEDGGAGGPLAVALLDREGCIEHSRGPTELWLQHYFGPPERPGRLPDEVEAWVRRQRARLDVHSGPEPASSFVRERDGRALELRLLRGRGVSEPDALLMVERRPGLSADELRSLGLTRREAEVLARAARGGSYEQIGADLWISPGTVHKHLEHVYAKLGVDSRAAAVTRAFERLEDHVGLPAAWP